MTNLIIVQKCSFQSSVYHSFRFQTTLSHDSVKSKAQYDCTSQRTNSGLYSFVYMSMCFSFQSFLSLTRYCFSMFDFVCCCDLISFCFVFSVDDMTASVSGGRKCCSSVWWCVLQGYVVLTFRKALHVRLSTSFLQRETLCVSFLEP